VTRLRLDEQDLVIVLLFVRWLLVLLALILDELLLRLVRARVQR
jgi:hypothetical protein